MDRADNGSRSKLTATVAMALLLAWGWYVGGDRTLSAIGLLSIIIYWLLDWRFKAMGRDMDTKILAAATMTLQVNGHLVDRTTMMEALEVQMDQVVNTLAEAALKYADKDGDPLDGSRIALWLRTVELTPVEPPSWLWAKKNK